MPDRHEHPELTPGLGFVPLGGLAETVKPNLGASAGAWSKKPPVAAAMPQADGLESFVEKELPVPSMVRDFPFHMRTSDGGVHARKFDISGWAQDAPPTDVQDFIDAWRESDEITGSTMKSLNPALAEYYNLRMAAFQWDVDVTISAPDPAGADQMEAWLRSVRPEFKDYNDDWKALHAKIDGPAAPELAGAVMPEGLDAFTLRVGTMGEPDTEAETQIDLREWLTTHKPEQVRDFIELWRNGSVMPSLYIGMASQHRDMERFLLEHMPPALVNGRINSARTSISVSPADKADATHEWLLQARPDYLANQRTRNLEGLMAMMIEPYEHEWEVDQVKAMDLSWNAIHSYDFSFLEGLNERGLEPCLQDRYGVDLQELRMRLAKYFLNRLGQPNQFPDRYREEF